MKIVYASRTGNVESIIDRLDIKDALKIENGLEVCDEEYILEGIEDNYNPKIAFRSNVKNLNLNTIADMNKIIKNIEFLSDITSDMDESSIEQNDNYLIVL